MGLARHSKDAGSRPVALLRSDQRFINCSDLWFLAELCIPLNQEQITQLYQQMVADNGAYPLKELLTWVPSLPKLEISLISLHSVLLNDPKRFEQQDDHWLAIKPPPPTWDQAIGAYYVYDPETYEIILSPGEKLKKKVAERLEELGYYAEVITAHVA